MLRGTIRAPWPRLLGLFVLLVAGIVVLPPPPVAQATSIVPFASRYSANDNGSIAIFGNGLQACPGSDADCAGARAGTNNKNNNSFAMINVDVDANATTFSSSRAAVTLPSDGEVKWAGLYWGARLGAGAGGKAATGNGRQMKLALPGAGGYQTITADQLFGPTTTSDRAYQSFADVTTLVRQAGPGTYTGADVPAATGEDRYAGWSLVVVYRSPSMPLRNLTVFDGLADVGQGDPQGINISGFRTPVGGQVNARVGLVAYEGDNGSSGDRAILRDASNPNGTLLATRLSQGTNFFNGANDDNGTLVTSRTPADRNMLGFDIKNFDGPGILGNSQSAATIDLASTSERYFPGVVTTAIDVFAPDFSPSTKSVANITGATPARVGDRLRYTVTFVNGGQDPAVNTSITDPIPPGTTYVAGSLVVPAGTTGSFDAGANAVQLQPGTFPVGRSVTFTFDVDVGVDAASTEVANSATITYDGATVPEFQDLTFATRAASIGVVPSADLVITKLNSPDPVIAGNVLTSTITVRNAGPSTATGVVVTDELPPGVTGVIATSTRGSCTAAVSCSVGTLPSGASETVTVRATVSPGATAASLTDVARVSADTADPDATNNTVAASAAVERNADLALTKSVTPATAAPGDLVTYTVTATNAGPSTATSVALTDTVVDPGVVLTGASAPGANCTFDTTGARCSAGSVAPGASVAMTITARLTPSATPGNSLTNTAVVQSGTPDVDPSDNSATATVTVGPVDAGLTVTKTASAADPLLAGLGEVRYNIEVASIGPSDADPVTVTDQLPAGFRVVSATSSRGTCTATAGNTAVECDLGTMTAPFGSTPGARAQITIVAEVPSDVATGTYANTATADAPGTAPVESDPASVQVSSRADLSIVKSFPQGSPDAILTPGTTETYRIRMANQGPSTASAVSVADALPAGLTATAFRVVSVTPTGPTPNCSAAAATCDIGSLPPGTVVELELDVDVPGNYVVPASGAVNSASVASDTTDPNSADNESSFTAGGPPNADVSIRKIPPEESPVAGANARYVLEMINFGPSDATGLVITDLLPPGTSFVRYFEPGGDPEVPGLCSSDGADPQETVTCDFGQFVDPGGGWPAFVGTRIGIEIAIDPTTPEGTLLENTATVSSDVPDSNPGNNTSSAVVSVRTEVNLRLEKLVVEMDAGGNPVLPPVDEGDDPLGVPPGHAVSFGLLVTNDGPSAASDVQVIDDVPWAGGNFPTGTCDFLTGDVVCSKTDGPLGPGEQFFTQLITLPDPNTPQGVYTNTARVTTSSNETDLADNTDSRTAEIIDPVADLIVNKQALTDPLVAGGTFSYRIAVRAGLISLDPPTLRLSSNAEDVVVSDALPPGLVPTNITSSQGDCTIADQDIRCELGTVRSGVTLDPIQPVLITVTGTVDPGIAGTEVANTAVATTSTALLGGGSEVSDSTTTPLERRADLSVTKTVDTPVAAAGGTSVFTVTVTNTGPSDATGVELTDLLPAPYVFDAQNSDPRCGLDGGDVVCDLGTVAPGDPVGITIAGTLPANAQPRVVENTASVDSGVADPDGSNNSASVEVEVVQAADLSVTKTPTADGVLLGGTIAYALVVTNNGPSDATAVELTESIPAGTSVQTLPSGCTGAGPVTCTLGELTAGATISLEIVLAVPETTPVGPLTNRASVASRTDDPDETDNEDAATVEAIADADVFLDKKVITKSPVAGERVVFEFVLTNRGPTIAPNPSLSDALPPGTSFVSFAAPGGRCQLDQVEDVPAASCSLSPLRVGASVTARLVLDTASDLRSITNTGYSGSGGLDGRPTDNEDTVEFQLRQAPPTVEPPHGSASPNPPGASPSSSGSPGGSSPNTGGVPASLLVLGLALLLGGAGMCAIAVRRRT